MSRFGTGWWLRSKTPGFGNAINDGGGVVTLVDTNYLHPAVTFSRASTATYMGPAGLLLTAATDVPRYEYDAAGNYLGLLIEEQRTNLLLRSTNWTIAPWIASRATVTPDATIGTDGALSLNRVNESSDEGTHRIYQAISKSAIATQYTVSVDVKAGTRGYVQVRVSEAGETLGSTVVVNLTTGVVEGTYNQGSGYTTISARTMSRGNGIYRVEFTFTTGTGTAFTIYLMPAQTASLSSPTYAGDAGKYIYAGAAHLEAGAFATSYIPTTSAAVTRGADSASFTVPSGIVRLAYTYDDNTTADVAVTPGAGYSIPTGQKRIKSLRGYRS